MPDAIGQRWTVVLDDDPTGTQGISGVPVVIPPSPETFRWAFARSDVIYVITNTRALDRDTAEQLVRDTVKLAVEVASDLDGSARFISRGDSTLRGHFPLEVQIVRDTSSEEYRGCLLVPAFPEAGRYTLDGTHYVTVKSVLRPVATTEYARDATFGYDQSRLVQWAHARVPADWQVEELPSRIIDNGPAAVARFLADQSSCTLVCPSIRSKEDLAVLAEGQLLAERDGASYLVQCAPSYVQHIGQLPAARPANPTVRTSTGLVVIGESHSHHHRPAHRIARSSPDRRGGARCPHPSGVGPRRRGRPGGQGSTQQTDGEHGGAVHLAQRRHCEQSRRVAAHRGDRRCGTHRGHTADRAGTTKLRHRQGRHHLVVARALAWGAATIVGPLVDATLPVWQGWRDDADDPVCVIFPGNVGKPNLLVRAVTRLGQLHQESSGRTVPA